MSLLSIGARCSSCDLVDFLPFTCPLCSAVYCREHIHTHGCLDDDDSANPLAQASGSRSSGAASRPRTRCPISGCTRLTIEAVGGREDGEVERNNQERDITTTAIKRDEGEEVARRVRCSGCGQAFCAVHRTKAAHACPAPEDETLRTEAATARKDEAQEILAKHFPDQAGRVIPKPPPARDVVKVKPASPPRLPPSLQPKQDAPAQATAAATPATKTKAEKLHELHVRKLRSLAKPLLPARQAPGEKRFFEWGVGTKAQVDAWEASGKWTDKLERVWVDHATPIGKVLDAIVAQAKLPRTAERPSLVALSAAPDRPRLVTPLVLSEQASQIPEGSMVILARPAS